MSAASAASRKFLPGSGTAPGPIGPEISPQAGRGGEGFRIGSQYAKAICEAVFLIAASWNIPLAAHPLDLDRSSVVQAEEPSIRTPDAHGRDRLAANRAWFREFKRDVNNDPADPHSDPMLARLREAQGPIDVQWRFLGGSLTRPRTATRLNFVATLLWGPVAATKVEIPRNGAACLLATVRW